MLKVVDSILKDDQPFTRGKLIRFEDNDVSQAQYEFIRENLIEYVVFDKSDYLVEFKQPDFEASTNTLSIYMTITIPDKVLRSDKSGRTALFEEQQASFKKFYENLKEQFHTD